ncbi:MAG: HAMP domain-containing protein [Polyangiaceae bacterium]|nr:HAMP domain-containing protein [Polyangiaceae bacterium]
MAGSRSARRYLIDPRFQLKWTGYLVVVVLAVTMGFGLVILNTAGRASDTAQVAVTQAEKAFKESQTNNILARSAVERAHPESAALAEAMNESLAELDAQSDKNLADVRRLEQEIASDRQRLRLVVGGAGLMLVLCLSVVGVVVTHRVVGPAHKLKRLLRRVSTGQLVVDERLRRGDELEELFDTFLQMTYSLRAMQSARVATLDATLRRAETTGAAEEVLEGLRALRAQMMLGIEKRRGASLPPPPPL